MNRRRTTDELDALLARGGLGPARRDAILEAVLRQTKAPSPVRRWWPWSMFAAGAVAATAVVLLVPRHAPETTGASAFHSKGLSTRPTHPAARIECLGGTLDACPVGSLLSVVVTGARGFVSAWAEPTDGGERIWYFSAEDNSPLVDGLSAGSTTASRAVKIGSEHAPGKYAVEIRVTAQPVGRSDVLRLPTSVALVASHTQLFVTPP